MVGGETEAVVAYLIDMVVRAPHLYIFTLLYWMLIAAVLVTRYILKRHRVSEVLMMLVVALGFVAVVMAFVDVAVRGRELIQISLVLYLVVPIGIGRFLIRKWDRRPVAVWRGLLLRETSYLTGFVVFVILSAVDGDLWWFTRPVVDRSSILTVIEDTNWLHLMATVFGAMAVVEVAVLAVKALTRRTAE
ncbi:hypothetical protein [Luethyella okanaganae]|uniref:Intracellular septation protein A n=1 Tax=Luethyella okanaganae TaxID=69372 RepID=A0ABW1VD75_9MICO